MIPDLHMHTTASDGTLAPMALAEYAAGRGVTIMAITDHDAFDGADSLRGADMKGLHLLGYGMTDASELRQTVRELAEKRFTRAERIVDKLGQMGFLLDYEAIRQSAKGTVGRLHIARAMVDKGYVRNTEAAFNKYIGEDREGYVPNESLTMAQALPLMRRNGFVPVLAHPAELELKETMLRMLIESWQQQGLMGVEVYHPSQQKRGFAPLDAAVRRMGLLVTGGSDFHSGTDRRHGQPGCTAQHWHNAQEDVEALLAAMKDQLT